MTHPKKSDARFEGIEREASNRDDIDKNKGVNDLPAEVGKHLHLPSIASAPEKSPSTHSNGAQVSTASRLAVRSEGAVFYREFSQLVSSARMQDTETSSENSVKNEFRNSFSALPAPSAENGPLGPQYHIAVSLLTKALFIEGRMLDILSLSGAIAPMPDRAAIKTSFYSWYQGLVTDGRILTSQSGVCGGGHSPYAFDLNRELPFSSHGSLRTLLDRFLDSDASSSAKRAALAATRVLLKLDAHTSSYAVLKAATTVPYEALHGLPSRFVAEETISGSLSKKTVANFGSALRAVIACGLRNDTFPLFFPPIRPQDAWTYLVDETFPLAAAGQTSSATLKARGGLFALFEEIRDVLRVKKPSELTIEHVTTALHRFSAAHRISNQTKVDSLRKVIGRASGDWEHPVIRVVVEGMESLRTKRGVPYLDIVGTPEHSVTTLPGFLAVLASHQMGAEWPKFFDWYRDYSLLTWRELDARGTEFPPRPPVRELSADTFRQRLTTARAYLGAARALFPNHYRTLTPIDVFGSLFREITQFLLRSWASAVVDSNSVSHESSAGLSHLVIGGGMIARALFDLEVHLREPRRSALELQAELSARALVDRERVNAERSGQELALLEAYNYSRVVGLNLRDERRHAESGSGTNTVKDLQRAIRETPFWKFQKAQDKLLAQVETDLAEGTALSRSGLARAVGALTHGILLSGGVRRSEICHLREGEQTHLLEGNLQVELRAVDRKNDTPHPFALRERWLPAWFRRHYLDSVRPAITRKDIASGIASSFLVHNPHAKRPYGCANERADGSGRDPVKLRSSKGQLAKLWRKHVGLAFDALGFEVPIGRHRFTMHLVRNVGGHAVFVTKGLEAAAHFLGDKVGTVEGVYAALQGELVDTSLLE